VEVREAVEVLRGLQVRFTEPAIMIDAIRTVCDYVERVLTDDGK